MITRQHVKKAVSYTLMFKGFMGFAFAALTICGIALPHWGIPFTPGRQVAAGGFGGILGAIVALRA